MCGRYDSHRSTDDLAAYLDAVDDTAGLVEGRYNTAPTQLVRIVAADRENGTRRLRSARWGLVPFWAKDPKIGARMINARAETAREKPAFRQAVRHTRALIPMDGWYEWRPAPTGKQPYYLTPREGTPLVTAGLWSEWDRGPDGPLLTCTILTTGAVGGLRDVHERMPLLLTADTWSDWLDPATDPAGLLATPPAADLVAGLDLRPISTAVGAVRNGGPHLLAPA